MEKFVCLECGEVFEEPRVWTEHHGLDYGPFETRSGCPYCGEPYTTAHLCDGCESYINGPYIRLYSGERFCDACYTKMELGDED